MAIVSGLVLCLIKAWGILGQRMHPWGPRSVVVIPNSLAMRGQHSFTVILCVTDSPTDRHIK